MSYKYNILNNRLKIFFDYYKKTGIYTPDTYWDDIRIPLLSTKLGGSKDPSLIKFKDNGSGSQGVFGYSFSPDQEEELYFQTQLPHSYKIGSDLHPHVHWAPSINGSEGQTVSWGLEYTIANINGVYGNTQIISANVVSNGDVSLVSSKHYLTSLPEIDGSSLNISAMLFCRVFRDSTGALQTDSYTGNAIATEIDFHYEMDAAGSRQLYIK